MPRGRPRLDPEIKRQHILASRQRYDEKNVESRREGARLRMQRKRAAIAASDFSVRRQYREKAATASEQYRDRKQAEQRAEVARTNAAKRLARNVEAKECRKKSLKKNQEHNPTCEDLDEPDTRCAPAPTNFATTRAIMPPRCPECSCEGAQAALACAQFPKTGKSTKVAISFRHARRARGGLPRMQYESLRALSLHHHTSQPVYAPDHGHEDRHTHCGGFFAIVSKHWKGVVTSERSLVFMLNVYPDARTFKAPTWSQFMDLCLLERQRQRNAAHGNFLAAEDARAAKEAALKLSKDELKYLGDFRPAPVTISPQRAHQLFTRVLGLGAAPFVLSAPPLLAQPLVEELPSSAANEPPVLIHEDGRPATPHGELAADDPVHEGDGPVGPQHRPPGFHQAAHERRCQVAEQQEDNLGGLPVLYAVRGRNRVFQDRDRAVAFLKHTPGAELMFSRDVGEVWDFFAEDVVADLKKI
ncbi:hypothetical protein B0H13DRAFT_1869647 [Mycena leptocephala]|nr:hypothetical protein B0H13DRAFT_1869647 [Mycena leptocephala]